MTPEPLWTVALKRERRVKARPPVITSDSVIQVFYYEKGSFYESTLLALDLETGAERWRTTIAHVVNEPIISLDGTAYVSSFEGAVYALDTDGRTRWKAQLCNRNMGTATFAGPQHILVAETGGRNSRTWCLDPVDGQVLWSFENGGHSYPIATTSEMAVHATAVSGPNFGETTIRLFALATKDGRVLWTASHDQYLFMPALVGDHVVVGARGAILAYRVDDGRLEARLDLGKDVAANVLVAGNAGLIAIDDENVLRLAALIRTRSFFRSSTELRQAWRTTLPAKAVGRPIEIDNLLAVMTEAGAVHLLSQQDGSLVVSYDYKGGDSGGAGGLAKSGDFVAAATGRMLRLFRSADLVTDGSTTTQGTTSAARAHANSTSPQ